MDVEKLNEKITLAMRMKAYEKATGTVLVPRMPTIIRVDGKAFHTFTKRITTQVDPSSRFGPSEKFHYVMAATAAAMCANMQNVACAYTQSDEISFLLRDYDNLESQQWFGGKVQKIASVSASMASAYFNHYCRSVFHTAFYNVRDLHKLALFDSRVFQIPREDATNYFIWRQQDATRNSVQFIGRKYFSHKQLHGKNNGEIQDMLVAEFGVNWNNYEPWKKRGACVIPNPAWEVAAAHEPIAAWVEDTETPIFTQEREYINKFVEPEKYEPH